MSDAKFSRRQLAGFGALGAAAATAIAGVARAQPPVHARGFLNPVIAANHPDPGILQVGKKFYLYSTAGNTGNMPVLRSRNLVRWKDEGDAMPVIAPWCRPGRHWAPEVIEVDGRFHAYYTAHDDASDRQAIGVAVADRPRGPFVDESDAPLLAQPEQGGCIDPSPFRDPDGQLWLLWKNDGNAADQPSYIQAQRLSPDGMTLEGEPMILLGRDQAWEIYTIEGAGLIAHEGRLYMFYSAGEYWNESYGVGVAVADAVQGPWTKLTDTPVLAANEVAAGPGHGMPLRVDDELWYVYHAWQPENIGEDPGRQVWLSRISIDGDQVDIDGPMIENPERPV